MEKFWSVRQKQTLLWHKQLRYFSFTKKHANSADDSVTLIFLCTQSSGMKQELSAQLLPIHTATHRTYFCSVLMLIPNGNHQLAGKSHQQGLFISIFLQD